MRFRTGDTVDKIITEPDPLAPHLIFRNQFFSQLWILDPSGHSIQTQLLKYLVAHTLLNIRETKRVPCFSRPENKRSKTPHQTRNVLKGCFDEISEIKIPVVQNPRRCSLKHV